MKCSYWDAGWCYAPTHKETTAENGACNKPSQCPQVTKKERGE